jgi:hypothetical protein
VSPTLAEAQEACRQLGGENATIVSRYLESLNTRPERYHWQLTDDVHDDAGGAGIRWRCPDCGCELIYAPSMWWELECSCKHRNRWDIDVLITRDEE